MNPFASLLAIGALTLAGCTSSTTFSLTDTNKDGSISTSEMNQALTDSVFDHSDADNDELITLNEWKVANPKDSTELFRARDKNKDGVIDKREWQQHVRDSKAFDELLTELDGDGDGEISPEDTEKFMTKNNL